MKNLLIISVLYPYESFEKAKLAFENAFSPSAKFQKKKNTLLRKNNC
jgi:hypothetical protein